MTQTKETGASRAGLPMTRFMHRERARHLCHRYALPTLTLWVNGNNEVAFRRAGSRARSYRAASGRFDFWAAGEYESITCGACPNETLHIGLPGSLTAEFSACAADDERWNSCLTQFCDPVLSRLVVRLAACSTNPDQFDSLFVESISAAVVERLAQHVIDNHRRTGAQPLLTPAARDRVAGVIEAQLASPPSVEDLSLVTGLSISEFLRAFRKTFGSSPHQYLLSRRIEQAKCLLKRDVPLTSIALELGFASHAHFSLTFGSRVGVSPSAWRGESGFSVC